MPEWRFPAVAGGDEPTRIDEPAHRPALAPPPAPEPPPQPAPKRRRVLVGLLALLALGLLAFAAVTVVRLLPWLAGPSSKASEIEARWAKVEAWARVEGAESSDELDDIARPARPYRSRSTSSDVPLVSRDELDPTEVEAVEKLVEWRKRGAPFSERRCDDPRRGGSSLSLFRLGQLALFSAADSSDLDQVEAVLVLSKHLRTRGTVLDLAIGASLLELTAKWSRARSTPLPPALRAYRMQPPEIHAALARDAACVGRMLETTNGMELESYDPKLGEPSRPRPPFGFVLFSRERRVYRDFHGRALEKAFDVRNDWRKMALVYEGAAAGKPKSLVLDATAVTAGVIHRAGEDMDTWNAIVR